MSAVGSADQASISAQGKPPIGHVPLEGSSPDSTTKFQVVSKGGKKSNKKKKNASKPKTNGDSSNVNGSKDKSESLVGEGLEDDDPETPTVPWNVLMVDLEKD
jgi:hypothetical protein